ncbi:unnamed protein product [Kuraishia capsulata CBS 1993]|uniref:pH-response regulator protein palF/RIM8 n=1 Tax=Kuraishia capsulata CBS 1993 TaxID=1382522 RepID=W6MK22_9ASCO|nr:uncharacterized protein KUCA_T00002634001 [Kuraishia capsulata CBS 1993]CDK26661.1 unnamed protein product [Kuraishia capsulata CBS 1993]
MRRAVTNLIPLNKTRILKTLKLDVSSVDDFYIELDDAHKTYLPGEEVKGQAILQLKKNLINVAVTLSLLGAVKLKNLSPSSSWRSSRKKVLFSHTIMIYGGDDADTGVEPGAEAVNGLTRGEHRFPFIVKLPKKKVFTSISFEKGSIRYSLKASLCDLKDKQMVLDLDEEVSKKTQNNSSFLTCEKYLNIVKPINVALFPSPKPKVLVLKYPTKKLRRTQSSSSTINSQTSTNSQETPQHQLQTPHSQEADPGAFGSQIKLTVTLQAMGYLRGEIIPVRINLQHFKQTRNINGIVVTLIRICRMDMGEDSAIQSFRKDLAQSILPLYLDPQTHRCELNTSLRVPTDAFPTIVGCEMVSFQYFVEVLVNLSNSKSSTNAMATPSRLDAGLDEENIEDVTTSSFRRQSIDNSPSPGGSVGWSSETNPTPNIFNVDKLKRMKNVITTSSEVIVGTERKISKRKKAQRDFYTESSAAVSPPASAVGSSTTSPGASSVSPQNLTDETSRVVSPGYAYTQPPPFQGGLSPSDIPTSPEVAEKEALRLRERALMPSEPDWSGDPEGTTAPDLPHNSHLLEYAIPAEAGSDAGYDEEYTDYVPMYVREEESLDTIHEDSAGSD